MRHPSNTLKVTELLKHSFVLTFLLSEQQMQIMWLLVGMSSGKLGVSLQKKRNKTKETKCHVNPLLASYPTGVMGSPHFILGVDDVT